MQEEKMAKYYVSKDDVLESIHYFKNLSIDNDAMLPAFLIAKHLGISLRKPITFTSAQQRDEILSIMWQLGGLQGKNETGLKRAILFPNSFKSDQISSNDFYNAGTEFPKLAGRIKDTVEKKNINVKLYDDNNKLLTLSRKYKDIINEEYLKGEKISLKHFACWIFRFIDFDLQLASILIVYVIILGVDEFVTLQQTTLGN